MKISFDIMKYYKMRTREKFLPLVRSGIKKHEYRLSTPDRQKIKPGDTLILVNNSDSGDYVKVIVKKVETFESLDEPLRLYGLSDFQTIFNSLDEIKNEFYHFYSRDKIRQHGVEIFEIELLFTELKSANVLLDTNIVIHRESNNNLAHEVLQLYKSLDHLKTNKYVVEDIKREIKKHKNQSVVENMLAKIETYNCLNTATINDKDFLDVVSKYPDDENSRVDNQFLYQVFIGNVDFLITDDKGILSKAKQLFLGDVVLSAVDFLNLVEKRYPTFIDYKVLSIALRKMSDIDINDHFFDTLREDYNGQAFDKWFKNKSKSGEKAYVFENNDGLQGLLYLKIEDENENYSDINPIFGLKKRLKIGTFKINSTGLRVGERFLKIIFDYAQKSCVDEIYLTLFEGKRPEVVALQKLVMSWGFEKYGHKTSTGETVLVKKMNIYRMDKDPKFNYPVLKEKCSYGILPIDYQYHTDLFPDLYLNHENMSLFEEKPCGYAIEKIYICKARYIPLVPGDLMAIYRMSERLYKKYHSVVSGICILQQIIYPADYKNFLAICKNRTVFEQEQLETLYFEKEYRTIVKVLFLKPLINKILLCDLLQRDIIDETNGPRISSIISKEKFNELLMIGGIDEL